MTEPSPTPAATNTARALAEFAVAQGQASIPEAVLERAKLLFLDSLGVAMRAWEEAPSSRVHAQCLDALGQRSPACGVIGHAARYAPAAAAELNAALIHTMDFDDTFAPGALHPSATALGAALSAAQMVPTSGARLLSAYVLGIETVCRVGVAVNANAHYDQGFHPTATCGAFGATVAAGVVLGLDAPQLEQAMGIALSQAAGSLQFLENGAWTKRYQVGHAARVGLTSAVMARAGYVGPVDALSGRHGFFRAYSQGSNAALAVDDLADGWKTLQVAIKPYPGCRFTHAAIDALIALRQQHGLRPEDVALIRCLLPRKGLLMVGEPIAQKRVVRSLVDAQFSMPFMAALALRDGAIEWHRLTAGIDDAGLGALAQRVEVGEDDEVEALFPASFGAKVLVRLHNGVEYQRFVETPKGEPSTFPDLAEVRQKFRGLVGQSISSEQASGIENKVAALELESGVADLLALTIVDAPLGQPDPNAP
jgi:2-methylcitrate dehydratase PrpD